MDTQPEHEDLWKVMKWAGYVYIPVAIVFIAVYLFVSYREQAIHGSASPAASSTNN